MPMKQKKENIFGRFFYSPIYVRLKNFLFNYKLRKNMIRKHTFNLFNKRINNCNTTIVDIGSGISPVSPFPEKTLFIDLEKEAVNFLKKQGFEAHLGDVTNLYLKNNSIDLIFCSEVLEHVRNYKKALEELNRVLKKEGAAIITVPVYEKYWKSDDAFVGHIQRFDPEILEKDIFSAGFKKVVKHPIGNWLERNLTWITASVARKRVNKLAEMQKISPIQLYSFALINYILYSAVRVWSLFSSEKSAGIMLYIAQK